MLQMPSLLGKCPRYCGGLSVPPTEFECIEILFFAGNPALLRGGQTLLINDTLYWRKAGMVHAGCNW